MGRLSELQAAGVVIKADLIRLFVGHIKQKNELHDQQTSSRAAEPEIENPWIRTGKKTEAVHFCVLVAPLRPDVV